MSEHRRNQTNKFSDPVSNFQIYKSLYKTNNNVPKINCKTQGMTFNKISTISRSYSTSKFENSDVKEIIFPKIKIEMSRNNSNNPFELNRSIIEKEILIKKVEKKTLKSKLLNIMKKYLVIDKDRLEKIRKCRNKSENFFLQNFGIAKNSNNHNDNLNMYTYLYEDKYITPEEMIEKYFNEDEINIIKSDLNYFNIGKDLKGCLKKLFKSKKLTEILEEEEKVLCKMRITNRCSKNDVVYKEENLRSSFIKNISKEKDFIKIYDPKCMSIKDAYMNLKY